MLRNRYMPRFNAAVDAPAGGGGTPAPPAPAAPPAPGAGAPAPPAPAAEPAKTPAQLPLVSVDLNAPEVQAAIKEAARSAAKEAAEKARKEALDAAKAEAEEEKRKATLTAEQAAKEAAAKAEREATEAKTLASAARREAELLRGMQRAGMTAQSDVAEKVIAGQVEAEVAGGATIEAALEKVKSEHGYLFKQPAAPAPAPAAPVETPSSPAAVAAAANLSTAPTTPASPPRAGTPTMKDARDLSPEEFRREIARLSGK